MKKETEASLETEVGLLCRLVRDQARAECEAVRLNGEVAIQLKLVNGRIERLSRVRTEPEDGERKREHGKETA